MSGLGVDVGLDVDVDIGNEKFWLFWGLICFYYCFIFYVYREFNNLVLLDYNFIIFWVFLYLLSIKLEFEDKFEFEVELKAEFDVAVGFYTNLEFCSDLLLIWGCKLALPKLNPFPNEIFFTIFAAIFYYLLLICSLTPAWLYC